jgi:predicted nucleic acid-binding Zn ribbon protein
MVEAMVTLEDLRQLMGRELLSRAFLLATRRLEEADADTIFALIVKAMECDARRHPHLWWAPMAPPGQGWCPVCGLPIVRRRRDAIYCSRRCGATARQRRRREKLAYPFGYVAAHIGVRMGAP